MSNISSGFTYSHRTLMIDAVFISDLHLHPNEKAITKRLDCFIEWALGHTRSVYILGDLFHVWPGDDAMDDWSFEIALKLKRLADNHVKVFFLRGNRDFLLGERFARLAHFTHLKEPAVITLFGKKILLVHGDRYCTLDKRHQWFRRFTRNPIFSCLFLNIPRVIRLKITKKMRKISRGNQKMWQPWMDVVPEVLQQHMKKHQVTTLIHGHTHRPGLTLHEVDGVSFQQFVLSDWDDNPLLMCYDDTNGFYFTRLPESVHAP